MSLCLLLSCSRHDSPTVYVLSPHASDIRLEFTRAFAAWHKAKYGYEVHIRWPDYGGTSDIKRFLGTQYPQRDSCGYDAVFGGGSNEFGDMARLGYLAPPPLTPAQLAAIPTNHPGLPMRGPDNLYFASTMSNFGIVINKVRLRELSIPTPRTWEDLADFRWFGNLSLADPSKSGSVRTAYDMVLRQYGWEKGWAVLTSMFANVESLKDSGSAPAEEADLGNAAGGIVIDFFARNHIAKQGPQVMGFVVPHGGTALDADPIAMLKGAPHAEYAAHLIEFVTSIEGQKLWVYRAGTPGGPRDKPLGRLAIYPVMYTDEQYAQYLFDRADPFTQITPMQYDVAAQRQRTVFLGDLMRAAFIDNHAQLRAARQAIRARGDHPADLARFGALPTFESHPLTPDRFPALLTQWNPKDPTHTERARTTLRDTWRREFATRFALLNPR